jgi:hypothetical protein
LHEIADRLYTPPPTNDLTELRVRARLAWNNWPDNAASRKVIAEHEARDQFSARAWDRVIQSVAQASGAP